MNDYELKQQLRRERLERKADTLKAEGAARYESGMTRLRAIPFGQPVHGIRDANYRRKAGKSCDRGFELMKEGDEVARQADAVGTGGISSDDPDAIAKLELEVANLERAQESFKTINKLVRKKDREGLATLGLSAETIEDLFTPDFCGRIGIPSYRITNNNANIRRIHARIAYLKAAGERESSEETIGEVRIVQNAEDNRLQLIFPRRLSKEAYKLMRSSGFLWSPNAGAFQRKLGGYHMIWARELATKINQMEGYSG